MESAAHSGEITSLMAARAADWSTILFPAAAGFVKLGDSVVGEHVVVAAAELQAVADLAAGLAGVMQFTR